MPNATPSPGEVWAPQPRVRRRRRVVGDLRGYFQRAVAADGRRVLVRQRALPELRHAGAGKLPRNTHQFNRLCSGPAWSVMRIRSGALHADAARRRPLRGWLRDRRPRCREPRSALPRRVATNCPSGGEDSAGWQGVDFRAGARCLDPGIAGVHPEHRQPCEPRLPVLGVRYSSGPSIESLGANAGGAWVRSLQAGGYLNDQPHSGYAMVGSPAIAADALPGSHPESSLRRTWSHAHRPQHPAGMLAVTTINYLRVNGSRPEAWVTPATRSVPPTP